MKEIINKKEKIEIRGVKYYVSLGIMILLISAIIVGIIYNYVFRDDTIYSNYTYISPYDYNSFSFKYPINWKVEMFKQVDSNNNEIYGVVIYIDKSEDREVIITSGTDINMYYYALSDEAWKKDFKLRRNNGGYAHFASNNFDDKVNYVIGFGGDNTVVKHISSMNISMEEDKYKQYKKQIYEIIKSVEVNQ